jgi:hypothetical protein
LHFGRKKVILALSDGNVTGKDTGNVTGNVTGTCSGNEGGVFKGKIFKL